MTSSTKAFKRYVEIARKSEEFNDIKEDEGHLEDIISQRWNSMSADERRAYERPKEKKGTLICKEDEAVSNRSPCENFELNYSNVTNPKSSPLTDETIVKFITTILASADFSQITKKTIREAICQNFKIDPSSNRQKINELIEQCLSRL